MVDKLNDQAVADPAEQAPGNPDTIPAQTQDAPPENAAARQDIQQKPVRKWEDRFKEVFPKLKEVERDNEAKTQDIQNLVAYTRNMEKKINSIEGRFADQNIPDPTEDPAGYAAYVSDKVKRENPIATPQQTVSPEKLPARAEINTRLQTQEDIQSAVHNDYFEVIDEVKAEFKNNSALEGVLMGKDNPAQAAYNYGIEQREARAKVNGQRKAQGFVESGTHAPSDPAAGPPILNNSQKRAAALLNVSEENYSKSIGQAFIVGKESNGK